MIDDGSKRSVSVWVVFVITPGRVIGLFFSETIETRLIRLSIVRRSSKPLKWFCAHATQSIDN
jgi:hypothetical protein